MDDLAFLSLAIRASNMAGLVALAFALLLLAKSLIDFSQTGPVKREVFAHHRAYLVLSLGRLTLAAFLIANLLALPGVLAYLFGLAIFARAYHPAAAALAAATSLGLLSFYQFCRVLHGSPGVIVASSHYAIQRFYPLWERLSPRRLAYASRLLFRGYGLWLALGVAALLWRGAVYSAVAIVMLHGLALLLYRIWVEASEPPPLPAATPGERPNLLMIGSDTLRADRLGLAGYRRSLAPNLDRLAERGAVLTQCYVPCARTAPSLLSLLTGTWPHSHGVRDNFVSDAQSRLNLPVLPHLLAEAGYRTAALSDWAGSDLGKFDLGFQELDLPGDQWNLRFLMRQGPKDIRLFLSLFLNNRIGKFFLEEIYYLGGVPLTRQLGLRARRMLERLGGGGQPFFLNVFMASTHPPFASEYPYYTMYADPAYRGPSKFAMAKLTDPFEIIRRQGEPREEFDLEQILDLYDGCVKSFDDELGRILDYLEASGLARNTVVVVYSDHGMEFFEHGTWGQGNSAIGDFSARIPVVLAGPAVPAGTRLDGVTRSIDVAPTLLDLLGLPPSPGMEGISLAPAMKGGALPDLPAFYETGIWLTTLPGTPEGHLAYPGIMELLEVPNLASGTLAIKPEYQSQVVAAKDRMIRHGRWKLVFQPLQEGHLLRLYDVEQDPGCKQDVIAAHPDEARALWEQLGHWMASGSAVETELAAPRPASETAATDWPLRLRRAALKALRSADDWVYEHFTRQTRVLFVLSDGYGFACQAPVIRALLEYPGVMVHTTSDRGQALEQIDFAGTDDQALYASLRLSTRLARLRKWHMVVDTHMNSFYPARNALRVYMHHGPGFGILGNKLAIIRQCDIFCGLSETELYWFNRIAPGLFGEKRVFFPIGFPKNDALCRGEYDRAAILGRLGLPDRRTLLITSHWQAQSTLRRLGDTVFRELSTAFPECNVIQTGHPWLWQPNHNVSAEWQQALLDGVRRVERQCPNARFVQTSDVESLLAVADLLVGDYSSVMTTYSLLDRPIVFFSDPEFQFTIPELKEVFVNASHPFRQSEELVPACIAAWSDPQAKATGRAMMRETFNAHGGRSGEFMAALIKDIGSVCNIRSMQKRLQQAPIK